MLENNVIFIGIISLAVLASVAPAVLVAWILRKVMSRRGIEPMSRLGVYVLIPPLFMLGWWGGHGMYMPLPAVLLLAEAIARQSIKGLFIEAFLICLSVYYAILLFVAMLSSARRSPAHSTDPGAALLIEANAALLRKNYSRAVELYRQAEKRGILDERGLRRMRKAEAEMKKANKGIERTR